MHLEIKATIHEDLFHIPWLRKDFPVHVIIDLTDLEAGKTFPLLGPLVTAGVSAEDSGDELDVDVKIAVYGIPVIDKKLKLADHISSGPVAFKEGRGQITVEGTFQVHA